MMIWFLLLLLLLPLDLLLLHLLFDLAEIPAVVTSVALPGTLREIGRRVVIRYYSMHSFDRPFDLDWVISTANISQ